MTAERIVRPENFYRRLAQIEHHSPHERHRLLSSLHAQILERYTNVVRQINPDTAGKLSSDGRTILQVVGHIAAWEQWTIQALGEIISGVKRPRIMDFKGFFDPDDGKSHDFKNDDDFNSYQAEKHKAWGWERMQKLATPTGSKLYHLFTNQTLLPPEVLETTEQYHYRLPDKTLTTTVGWYLWMISIEHEAVEHTKDLSI